MMKRILLVLTVALMMAAMMVVSAMPAFAFANRDSEGGRGVGQETATENCQAKVNSWLIDPEKPSPSNGHQADLDLIAPTNCNHFFPVE
jgi:hypothetical protein